MKYLATLCNLSYLLCRQGEQEKALFYIQELIRQLDNNRDLWLIIMDGGLEQVSGVLSACGEFERAARFFGFSEASVKN